MVELPLDEAARDTMRLQLLEEYTLRAVHRAGNHLVSLKCQSGGHRCTNNGSSCLCRCHDRKRPVRKEPYGTDG